MTDPPRRQALGAVKVQPGAAFLPSLAQVWKITKNQQNQRASSRSRMRVLGLMDFLSINKVHNTAEIPTMTLHDTKC